MFAVSKQLLKLSTSLSYDSQLLNKSLLELESADQQEQNLILEIIGGALERLCLHDEVVYLEKALSTMPHLLSNEPMVVMRVNHVAIGRDDFKTTVTLFNRADLKFIEVPQC